MRRKIYCPNIILGFVLLTLYPSFLLAQSDRVSLRVSYIVTFKEVVEAKRAFEDEMILEVGECARSFYGRWKRKRLEVLDSLGMAGASREEYFAKVRQYPTPKATYSVYVNHPRVGKTLGIDQVFDDYIYEEDIEVPKWTFLTDTLTVVGYRCGAARCHYRGRDWTAYYTLEIPVDAGPWKLSGLPGLILKAEESSGVFSFECIGVYEGRGEPLYLPNTTKYIKCTRQELMALKKEHSFDPKGTYKRKYGMELQGWGPDGKPLKYPPKTALFLDY